MTADLGELTTCFAVTYRREVPHPPDKLWWAITDPDALSKWWFSPARVDLRPGGEYFIDFASTTDVLPGVIVAVEPDRLLRVAWDMSVFQWSIEPTDSGCRYTFVHQGNRLDEPDSESYEPTGFLAGWHAAFDGIAAVLDGTEHTEATDLTAYNQVHPGYKELFNRHFQLN